MAGAAPGRIARILLVVSLVLNVFLVGAIAGGVWRWTHDHSRGGWRVRAAGALPPDSSAALRQTMRETMRAGQPLVRDGRAAREAAARLFVQPRFDGAAVLAELDRARAADMALRSGVERHIVAFAATLPQDQRAALAAALRAGPLREGRRHVSGDGSPGRLR